MTETKPELEPKPELNLSCPLCEAAPEKAELACPCCKRRIEGNEEPNLLMLAVEELYCQACRCKFPTYLLGEAERRLLTGVREALKAQSDGRNSHCWPLVSFGGKDADLSPEGCTGIEKICGAVGDRLVFAVGGHKTFVDSSCLDDASEALRAIFDDSMRDIVCDTGFPVEWTGDDWCASFSTTVELAIAEKPDGTSDFEATAAAVIVLAEKAVAPFEQAMADANAAADELYKTITAQVKKAKSKKAKRRTK